jgi:drug/metabolite transporter (DMT)-like permease
MQRAWLLLIISAILWGGVFHVIKYPLSVAPPFVVIFVRFALTVLLLLPWLLARRNYRDAFGHENLGDMIFLALVGICAYNAFFTYGMALSEPATGSLIIAANPAMTTFISRLWKKEIISPIRWVGVVLAFFGLVFIVFEGSPANVGRLQLGAGNLVLLGAPFAWAIYSVKSREVLQRVPTTVFTAAIILLSLPPQAVLGIAQLRDYHWATRSDFWLPVLYLGVLATGVSYLCWNKGVELIGAARSSVFVNLIPVTALLIALLLGQPLYAYHYIGGAIVVAGVLLATRK